METSTTLNMADNSQETVAKTIKEYGNQIAGFIRSKVSDNEDAKDILQDVWYQLSRLANIDNIESMSGWLFRIARNRITDSYRKKKPERLENFSNENEEGQISFKEILLLDDTDNQELALFKEVFWSELLEALDELPENQKEVFVLNEIEDITLQQIADKTETPLKTVISRKGYAVKHLRKKLNYLYEELYS